MSLGHTDHVHSAAVPARALKVQVPPTRLHQVLCSLYAQPGGPMPATIATGDGLVRFCAISMHRLVTLKPATTLVISSSVSVAFLCTAWWQ